MDEVSAPPAVQLEHCYEGIIYPNVVLDSSIAELRSFHVRPDDVWVLTFPKSGTHWMMEIVGLILNDGWPDNVDRGLFSSTLEMVNMAQTFPRTVAEEKTSPVDMTPFLRTAEAAPSPRVMMTHLRAGRLPPDLLKKAKVIYFARNPKDVTTSWFNFVGGSEFIPTTWEKNFQDFLDGKMHWGSWCEHVKDYLRLNDEHNLLFVLYEDMLKDTSGQIRRIAEHLGHPLSAEALQRVADNCKLSSMKKKYRELAETGQSSVEKCNVTYPFLQKGAIGRWKHRFTVAQNEVFDQWYHDNMADTGLNMIFE